MSGSAHNGRPYARYLCTILKVVRRRGWSTRLEIFATMGIKGQSGEQLETLRALEDEGLLECRPRQRPPGARGPQPSEFRLSPSWRDDA